MNKSTTYSIPSAMEIDTFPAMPENIWLDIFGYLTLTEKAKVARYDNDKSEKIPCGTPKKKNRAVF
jgi:hypothetical protein